MGFLGLRREEFAPALGDGRAISHSLASLFVFCTRKEISSAMLAIAWFCSSGLWRLAGALVDVAAESILLQHSLTVRAFPLTGGVGFGDRLLHLASPFVKWAVFVVPVLPLVCFVGHSHFS